MEEASNNVVVVEDNRQQQAEVGVELPSRHQPPEATHIRMDLRPRLVILTGSTGNKHLNVGNRTLALGHTLYLHEISCLTKMT